jgi:hypothetical protein
VCGGQGGPPRHISLYLDQSVRAGLLSAVAISLCVCHSANFVIPGAWCVWEGRRELRRSGRVPRNPNRLLARCMNHCVTCCCAALWISHSMYAIAQSSEPSCLDHGVRRGNPQPGVSHSIWIIVWEQGSSTALGLSHSVYLIVQPSFHLHHGVRALHSCGAHAVDPA